MATTLNKSIFVQTCIPLLEPFNFENLIDRLEGDLPLYSSSKYGTRLVQVLVENLTDTNMLQKFNKVLIKHLDSIINDQNGSYLVTKYVESINYPYNEILYEKVMENAAAYACGGFSNKVLTRFIYYAEESQIKPLIAKVMENLQVLLVDKNGHTVIQYLLVLKIPEVNQFVLQVLMSDVANYTKHKYAAGVFTKVDK